MNLRKWTNKLGQMTTDKRKADELDLKTEHKRSRRNELRQMTDPNSSDQSDLDLKLILGEEEEPNLVHKNLGEKSTDFNKETLPMPPTHQQDDRKEGYRKLSISSARLALEYYNKCNHTKYELLGHKPLASNNFTDHRGFWTHCCFYAKDPDHSPNHEHFFAEIHTLHFCEPEVTCMILQGETRSGCAICSSVTHPVDGFLAGCLEYNSRHASSSSSDDDEYSVAGVLEYLENTKITVTPPDSPPHHHEWRQQNIKFANLALDYYNGKNNTKFKLVEDEIMASTPLLNAYGVWIHCCFNAKDSFTQLFFGEVHFVSPGKPVVTTCKFLEEGKTRLGCQICMGVILHPVDGFQAGFSEYDNDHDNKDHLMDPNLVTELVETDKHTDESPASPPTHQEEH